MYFEEPKHDPVSSACLMESHRKIPFIIMIYREKKENKMLEVSNNTDADCRKKNTRLYRRKKYKSDGLRQPKAFDVSKWIQNIASQVAIESRSFIGYLYTYLLNRKKRRGKNRRAKRREEKFYMPGISFLIRC